MKRDEFNHCVAEVQTRFDFDADGELAEVQGTCVPLLGIPAVVSLPLYAPLPSWSAPRDQAPIVEAPSGPCASRNRMPCPRHLMTLADKVVVVTGASAGIGAAVARRAAQQGARVALLARRKEKLAEVAAACGDNVLVLECDVTQRKQVEQALQQTVDTFGTMDIWVNNAGRGVKASFFDLTDEDWDDMLQVNLFGATNGMKASLNYFKSRPDKTGHVINVSSVLGRIGALSPLRGAYSAAKHALNGITSAVRAEMVTEYPNIVLSTVSPGPVATDFGLAARHDGNDSRSNERAQDPNEVADVILQTITTREEEVYTRPEYATMMTTYFKDIQAAEKVLHTKGMQGLLQ